MNRLCIDLVRMHLYHRTRAIVNWNRWRQPLLGIIPQRHCPYIELASKWLYVSHFVAKKMRQIASEMQSEFIENRLRKMDNNNWKKHCLKSFQDNCLWNKNNEAAVNSSAHNKNYTIMLIAHQSSRKYAIYLSAEYCSL